MKKIKAKSVFPVFSGQEVKGFALRYDGGYIGNVQSYGDGGEWLNETLAKSAAIKEKKGYMMLHPKLIPVEIHIVALKKSKKNPK